MPGTMMRYLRRAWAATVHFVGGPRRYFVSGWAPHCYCQVCGQCAHEAKYRFPQRFLHSCEACLTCPSSNRILWSQWKYDEKTGRSWYEHDYPVSFEIPRAYRLRSILSGFLMYLVAKWIMPKDPPVPADGAGAAHELRPEAK